MKIPDGAISHVFRTKHLSNSSSKVRRKKKKRIRDYSGGNFVNVTIIKKVVTIYIVCMIVEKMDVKSGR